MKRKFEGIWIPEYIWLAKDLTLQEKVFYVEIKSLDNDDGCWASNQYFATFFDLSKVRVSEIISSLAAKKYISVYVDQSAGNKRILKTLIKESLRPSQIKVEDPLKETFKHNNKDNNTYKKEINTIFDFWKETMSLNGNTLFTAKRKKAIADRLVEGYTAARIHHAILGCSISQYHQGKNEHNEVYNDIELICRSGEKLEKHESRWLQRDNNRPMSTGNAGNKLRVFTR